jgi:hypothetical protein
VKTPKILLSLKPTYPQAPVGWWQDAKRNEQPPGSFLDPSLRRTDGTGSAVAAAPAPPAAKSPRPLSARRAKRALR